MAVGNVPDLSHPAEILGFQTKMIPSMYLGLPLGGNHRTQSMWDPVLERVDKRLAGWKGRYLSKGGKITLIKSALANLPIYYLSLFRAPNPILKKLKNIRKNFLWDTHEGEPRFHMVSWKKVYTPMENGGLGIRGLKESKKALLSKWLRGRVLWLVKWQAEWSFWVRGLEGYPSRI